MKKTIAIAALALSFVAGAAFADRVRDWQDIEAVHQHVQEAIHELERARAANHYDMAGHGVKAEQHLRQAEHELHEAVEWPRRQDRGPTKTLFESSEARPSAGLFC